MANTTKTTLMRSSLLLMILALLTVVHCTGQMGGLTDEMPGGSPWDTQPPTGPEEDPGEPGWDDPADPTASPGPWEAQPACDPDGVAPCPEDYFICTELDDGNKVCEGQLPATPDGGEWDCYEEGTTLVCLGDHSPSDNGMWTCIEAGGNVVCRSHAYIPADGSAEGWTCWYEGELRVCSTDEGSAPDGPEGGETGEETGDEPNPVDQGEADNPWDDWFPDNDGDGIPDDLAGLFEDLFDDWINGLWNGGGDEPDQPDQPDEPSYEPGRPDRPDGCVCVPGAWRYCDTPTYCRWGVQYCADNGMRWGECVESAVPGVCGSGWYSPEAEGCCVEAGFCCQDMWDLDMDGDTWESLGNCADVSCG